MHLVILKVQECSEEIYGKGFYVNILLGERLEEIAKIRTPHVTLNNKPNKEKRIPNGFEILHNSIDNDDIR